MILLIVEKELNFCRTGTTLAWAWGVTCTRLPHEQKFIMSACVLTHLFVPSFRGYELTIVPVVPENLFERKSSGASSSRMNTVIC